MSCIKSKQNYLAIYNKVFTHSKQNLNMYIMVLKNVLNFNASPIVNSEISKFQLNYSTFM